ncbi:MAG: hypothetical protein ABI776_11155 [Nocardioidaceae bacterium]
MSEQPSDPADPGELDVRQFVGEPPAGDASPTEFASNDQSAPPGEQDDQSDARPDEKRDDEQDHEQDGPDQ